MISKSKIVRYVARKFTKTDLCGVKGCPHDELIEVVELKPFDPIDHDSTFVALCREHRAWADERNAFAEEMADELRERRKEIGQEHIKDIQRLSIPQSGDLREDILMGDTDEEHIALEDAFEETQPELDESTTSGLLTGDY